MEYKYKHVCLGGTFDHLHAGHKRILDFAFHTGETVTIGLTSDSFIQKKSLSKSIQSFEQRREQLMDYLAQSNTDQRLKLFPLETIYGTADTDDTIEAIIVTRETYANALKINQRRVRRSLLPLKILSVPFFKGDDRKVVRAERIRRGSIDRMGNSYKKLFTKAQQLNLPTQLRELLRKPLGRIIEGTERNTAVTAEKTLREIKRYSPILTILVGDIVSDSLVAVGCKPNIIIRDNRSKRKDLESRINQPKGSISNPPGTIRRNVVRTIQEAIITPKPQDTQVIIVNGEEDLLALPAILLSPLNSVVVYGQAGLGIIFTIVTEEKKEQVAKIIQQFE